MLDLILKMIILIPMTYEIIIAITPPDIPSIGIKKMFRNIFATPMTIAAKDAIFIPDTPIALINHEYMLFTKVSIAPIPKNNASSELKGYSCPYSFKITNSKRRIKGNPNNIK